MEKRLVNSQSFQGNQLSERSLKALNDRISASAEYNIDETIEVSEISHRLIPKDFEIDPDISDEIRSLCIHRKLPRIEKQISSHRKFIGPVIVMAKKLLWRFLGSQIRENFRYVEDFNTQVVINQIRSSIRYQELKQDPSRVASNQ